MMVELLLCSVEGGLYSFTPPLRLGEVDLQGGGVKRSGG